MSYKKTTNITTVYGSPGTGKTYYLMELLKTLLNTYKPEEIAFVSFTRNGAYDGRRKAMEKFNFTKEQFPYFRTLHSIAFRSAELNKKDVMTSKNYKEFSASVGMTFTGYYTEELSNDDDKFLAYYFLQKNNPKMAEKKGLDGNPQMYEYIKNSYNNYKATRGLVDYTDMLEYFIEADQALPVRIAIIDECQDLTSLQFKLCEVAFRDCSDIWFAGDDDQAVFNFQGADLDYFLALKGERVILNKSYRMPSNVLKFAQQISSRISNRVDKQFAPRAQGGLVTILNTLDNFDFKKDETYYLLARNNYHLVSYEEALRKRGLVYLTKLGKSVSDRLVGVINAHEYKRKNGVYATELDSLRVKQCLIAGNEELPWYDAIDMPEEDKEYYRDVIYNKTDLAKVNLKIGTIHSVKGGEADNVILMLDMTRRTHINYNDDVDNEMRCLYVGCTRAKKNLYLMPTTTKYGYDEDIPIAKIVKRIGAEDDK